MLRQIRLLSGIQLCNLFRFNEIRHTKDKRERLRYALMGASFLLVAAVLAVYVAGLAYGFVMLGMGELVPVYLFAVTSILIAGFTFLKAGSIIFQSKTYEMMIALPVSRAAIVVSRFLTMYVTNLLLGVLVMGSGFFVCGMTMHPPVGFYVWGLAGTLLLPLLPVCIAVIFGAGITAISSRMRHKSIVETGLVLLLMIGIMVLPLAFSSQPDPQLLLMDMAGALKEQIGKLYPPAVWFGQAVSQGKPGPFLLFTAGAFLLFAAMIAVLQQYFTPICSALNASGAKNNYRMGSLKQQSPLTALWKKELRRYFASSIYVINTSMGYILMAVFAGSLHFMGMERAAELGITEKMLPFLLAVIASIMPTTSCSISLEGKWWWIVRTLPVSGRQILDSKLLVNLTVAAPFYLAAVTLGILAVSPGVVEAVWIILIPAVYILFTAVAGLTVNLAFPVFRWENETQVVKQSASTMITMLVGMAASILPAVLLFFSESRMQNGICLGTVLAVLAATAVLYGCNNRKMRSWSE